MQLSLWKVEFLFYNSVPWPNKKAVKVVCCHEKCLKSTGIADQIQVVCCHEKCLKSTGIADQIRPAGIGYLSSIQ